MVDQTDDGPADADSDVDAEDVPVDDTPAGDADPDFEEPISSDGEKSKSPVVAAVLSLVFPGLGHVYSDGLTTRALLFGLFAMFSFALIFVGVGLFTSPILSLVAAFDAYNQTSD